MLGITRITIAQQEAATPSQTVAEAVPTPQLIAAMLRGAKHVSDLIFSPGRAPQVESSGQLVQIGVFGIKALTAEDTARIAADLIGSNKAAIDKLREQGSCDISYSLAGTARFRVNIFTQRGSCAIVMRVIPSKVPDFASLSLPPQLMDIVHLRNGIVLVTGPTGSGKSSTLAAILDQINMEKAYHDRAATALRENVHAKTRRACQAVGNVARSLLSELVYCRFVRTDQIGGDARRILRREGLDSEDADLHQLAAGFHLGSPAR